MRPVIVTSLSFIHRCHAVNVCDDAAYFYLKINEDLQIGGLNVLAEKIIDIIDGYKGEGYGKSTEEELVCRFWFLHNRTSSQAVPPFSEKSVGQKEKKTMKKVDVSS